MTDLDNIPDDAKPESPGDQFRGVKQGIVKYFENSYGFVQDPENQDHFVHYRSIDSTGFRNLAKGQHVLFYSWFNPSKGLYAKKVKVVS